MVSLIQRFSSNVASTVYAYTPSMSTIQQVAAKGYQYALQAPSIALKSFEIAFLPTDFLDQKVAGLFESFSLKKAIETPLTPEVIEGFGYYLELFFEQVKLPFADKVTRLIKDAMQKPLKLDDDTYASLVNEVISPMLTEENVNKTAGILMGTLRHLIHAVHETEKKPAADKKQELLKQLGVHTNFNEFKRIAQIDIEANFEKLIDKLSVLIGQGKNPFVLALIKLGLAIVSGILTLFSSQLTESFYRFALTHYLSFCANKKGDITFKALGLEFTIPKAELDFLHQRFSDYKEILFWALMQKLTTGLANFETQKSNVDEEWGKLLDELEPVLKNTVASVADHARTTSMKDKAIKFVGKSFLQNFGVRVATSYLYQIEPSVLIKTMVKGLRKGFFSHKA